MGFMRERIRRREAGFPSVNTMWVDSWHRRREIWHRRMTLGVWLWEICLVSAFPHALDFLQWTNITFLRKKKIYKMFIWKLATNKKNVNIYLKDWKENTLKILFVSFWVECYLILWTWSLYCAHPQSPCSLCPVFFFMLFIMTWCILCLLNYLFSAFLTSMETAQEQALYQFCLSLPPKADLALKRSEPSMCLLTEWMVSLVSDFNFLLHTFLRFQLFSNELLLLYEQKKMNQYYFFLHGNSTMEWHLNYDIWE